MNELTYATQDDFSKAAAWICRIANDGLKDAQARLASEGFFKRRRLAAIFEPSMKMMRMFLMPASEMGLALVRDPAAAEAYCREIWHSVSRAYPIDQDGLEPSSRKLMYLMLSQMQERTADVLTKRSHDEVWFGSETFADELRQYVP